MPNRKTKEAMKAAKREAARARANHACEEQALAVISYELY
jgi:hypothetical protein